MESMKFSCDEDLAIVDACSKMKDIPYSCRNGSCSSCTNSILGSVDQEDQMFLMMHQIEEGYVLTCAGETKIKDCVIETDKESGLINYKISKSIKRTCEIFLVKIR